VVGRPHPDWGEEVVAFLVPIPGAAVAAAELDSLFQPFRSSFEKGTGLGLAIVHRIVTDYAGSIQVSSTVGTGTTVRVCLPMRASGSDMQTIEAPVGERDGARV